MKFQPYFPSLIQKFLMLLALITVSALSALFFIERFIVMPKLISQEDNLAGAALDRLSRSYSTSSTRENRKRIQCGRHPSADDERCGVCWYRGMPC